MPFDAVIVAAGSSNRFGSADKLTAELCGRPVLAWSLAAFEAAEGLGCLVVVAASDRLGEMTELAGQWCPKACFSVVAGGSRRRDSVGAGPRACQSRFGVIHDGSRPLVTTSEITERVSRASCKP